MALCSIPSIAKADDFRVQFGIGSNGFAVGLRPDEWRERAWREHKWREHQWREYREVERARYYENTYYHP